MEKSKRKQITAHTATKLTQSVGPSWNIRNFLLIQSKNIKLNSNSHNWCPRSCFFLRSKNKNTCPKELWGLKTGADWRSKRTLRKTESTHSFLEGPSWFLGWSKNVQNINPNNPRGSWKIGPNDSWECLDSLIFIKIVNPSSDWRRPLGAARRAVGSWEVKASHFIRMWLTRIPGSRGAKKCPKGRISGGRNWSNIWSKIQIIIFPSYLFIVVEILGVLSLRNFEIQTNIKYIKLKFSSTKLLKFLTVPTDGLIETNPRFLSSMGISRSRVFQNRCDLKEFDRIQFRTLQKNIRPKSWSRSFEWNYYFQPTWVVGVSIPWSSERKLFFLGFFGKRLIPNLVIPG